MKRAITLATVAMLLVAACNTDAASEGNSALPYASLYQPLASRTTLLHGATILDGTGERFDEADVLMRDGRIVAIGKDLVAGDAVVVDVSGMWAEHAVWPQDPGFVTALAGGITAMQILPGSANLIGGRSVTC